MQNAYGEDEIMVRAARGGSKLQSNGGTILKLQSEGWSGLQFRNICRHARKQPAGKLFFKLANSMHLRACGKHGTKEAGLPERS